MSAQPCCVILGVKRPKDWRLGGVSGIELPILRPDGQWVKFTPEYEPQNQKLETMACVSFSHLNCLETLNRHANITVNYSDRFLAKMSGTTAGGNSLWKVAETIRTVGLVDEQSWPWPAIPATWDDYYREVPDGVKGRAVVPKGYSWRWVGTGEAEMKEALKYGPLQVCNNIHAFCVVGYNVDGWLTFDTYGEGHGFLPYGYKFAGVILPALTLTPMPKDISFIPDNALVIVADSGERLMKVGTKLYSDDSGKILLEVAARNAKDGMFVAFPIKHYLKDELEGVPRFNLKNEPL